VLSIFQNKRRTTRLKEKILGLIRLQEFDDKISRLDSIKKDCPIKILKLEEELNACRASFQGDSENLESIKKERRKTEQVTLDLDGKIEKSQVKLSNIKSNKEYTAALKEIEDLNKEKVKVEDGIIRFMEEIEASEKKCLENKNEIDRLQKAFDLDKKKIEQQLEELNKESAVLEEERQKLSSEIDKELLSRYDFLKARKGGIAIGSVIESVCQLCHIKLPPQRFHELIRCNALMSCPNCNRLIYWGEDEFFAKALGNAADLSVDSD
jgi:uncharacterized protein